MDTLLRNPQAIVIAMAFVIWALTLVYLSAQGASDRHDARRRNRWR
jgi:multisubunit Na+/H+ antiporter MnhC subunit